MSTWQATITFVTNPIIESSFELVEMGEHLASLAATEFGYDPVGQPQITYETSAIRRMAIKFMAETDDVKKVKDACREISAYARDNYGLATGSMMVTPLRYEIHLKFVFDTPVDFETVERAQAKLAGLDLGDGFWVRGIMPSTMGN